LDSPQPPKPADKDKTRPWLRLPKPLKRLAISLSTRFEDDLISNFAPDCKELEAEPESMGTDEGAGIAGDSRRLRYRAVETGASSYPTAPAMALTSEASHSDKTSKRSEPVR
jgi:hypothetical protein